MMTSNNNPVDKLHISWQFSQILYYFSDLMEIFIPPYLVMFN